MVCYFMLVSCIGVTSWQIKKKKKEKKKFSWPLLFFFVGSVVNEPKHLSSFQMIFVIELLQFLFFYFVNCKIIENSKDFVCLACKSSDLPQMPVVSMFSRAIHHGGIGTTLGLVCARSLPYNYKCPGYHLLHTIHVTSSWTHLGACLMNMAISHECFLWIIMPISPFKCGNWRANFCELLDIFDMESLGIQ